MKKNQWFFTLILALFSFLNLSFADDIHHGKIDVALTNISAVSLNGETINSEIVTGCGKQYAYLLNSMIHVQYTINTKTQQQSATAYYSGTNTNLSPEGLTKSYAFMSDGVASPITLKRIIVDIDKQFQPINVELLFLNQNNANIQCELSSNVM